MPSKDPNERKDPNNHKTRFKGKGAGLKSDTQALSVRFPPAILDTLKADPARQDFIRAAVVEKLEREARLPLPESTIAPTSLPPAETTPKKTRRTPAQVSPETTEAIAPALENPPEEKPAAKKRTPRKGAAK